MTEHQGREKKFSLGFFDEALLDGRPVAVVRKDDQIVAFANLWETPDKSELSLDLMRYVDVGVNGLMNYLMVEIMLWCGSQCYRHFMLGMAPLSGIDGLRLAPDEVQQCLFTFHAGFRKDRAGHPGGESRLGENLQAEPNAFQHHLAVVSRAHVPRHDGRRRQWIA